MTEVAIRRATLQDVPQIVACVDAAYATYRDTIADLPAVSEGLDEDVKSNQVWIAELDSSIIGVVVLVAGDNSIKLANLAVHPECGGQGIGKSLISHAEHVSRQQGFAEIKLNTHADMTGTQRLYQRLGWAETNRDGATVMMTKRL